MQIITILTIISLSILIIMLIDIYSFYKQKKDEIWEEAKKEMVKDNAKEFSKFLKENWHDENL